MAGIKFTEQQGKDFALVIEQTDTAKDWTLTPRYFKSQLASYARKEGFKYFGVLHDFDIDELGERKRNHYHLVLRYPSRHRIGAVIKKVGFMFNVSDNCVSIIKTNDVLRDIRYLIHLDEDGLKTPYPSDDVCTNDSAFYESCLMKSGELSVDEVMNIISRCDLDRVQIVRELGLRDYTKWRNVINDCLYDLKGGHK